MTSIRTRLTLLYGGLFLLAGGVLNTTTYLLVRSALGGGTASTVATTGSAASKKLTAGQLDQLLGAKQRAYREEVLHTVLTSSTVVLLLVVALALALGLLVTGRALRPLRDIATTARRVADRNLHERIPLPGPRDALRELAETFNAMLGRLDRAFDSQRRFTANASHELKTPLAIGRTLLEVALTRPDCPAATRTLAETLLSVNARHERLVDGLLLLARTDHRVTDTAPVDLAELVDHVLERRAPDATATGVALRRELAGPATVEGDAVLLERLADNLIRNGVRHNVPDGWVSVAVRGDGGRILLEVTNSGPPVAGYDIPRLLEPFQRGTGERVHGDQGVGLGLPIVRAIAHTHDGTLDVHPRPHGGLTVTVTLDVGTPTTRAAG